MLYVKSITASPGTTPLVPATEEVEVYEDTLVAVFVRFPPGSAGLLKCSLWYGVHRIFPHYETEWAYGDDEIVYDFLLWRLPEKPTKLIIKAYNYDIQYDHTAIFRILALNRSDIYKMLGIGTIAGLFTRLLWRRGVG